MIRSSLLPARSAVVRRGLAAAALVVAGSTLAACSSTASDSEPSAVDAGEPGPGVSDDTVKIGFIALKDDTAGNSGFVTPEEPPAEETINALVDWVNANGGIAGRTVEPVIREFDTSTDSPQTEEALCQAFTRDDEVFAVVMRGQYQGTARACYAGADTMMIDQTLAPVTAADLEESAPYLWTPSLPEWGTAMAGQVEGLVASGWLAPGDKVGIAQKMTDAAAAVVEDRVVPALEAGGIDAVTVATFDPTDATGASIQSAIGTMQRDKVEKVLVLGNPDTAAQFMFFGGQTGFAPAYALNSFDLPGFFSDNAQIFPPGSMDYVSGIGFLPPKDVRNDDFPANDAEQTCVDALAEGGVDLTDRASSATAFQYCDALTLLQAAGGEDGDVLNAANVAENAADSDWQAAMSLGTDLSGDVYAPASVYHVLTWDPKSSSFVYGDDELAFTAGS
ncbi:hypothetical protein E8D34_04290 [Nocardioides sp. GY 10113]|uniref:ABC transporter substrate-binding protein n=1 Tax=Nocardioides sp. GY 10113 TaxID=2569761 RepID=UPI0010A826D9|nr:ABC transporter substrate-binding protein [Nocardioides sp. GY 10113]TIC88877.1 hypothetical protein E8D34_04290 [Nocardioides sp. GY 10113]